MLDNTIIAELGSELKSEEVVSIGGDIELFITDTISGKVLAAEDYTKGTKEEPLLLSKGVFVHPDNIMLEFGFTQGDNKESFVYNLTNALNEINREFDNKPKKTDAGFDPFSGNRTHLLFEPAINISDSINELITSNKFTEVGCDPFRTAYNSEGQAFNAEQLGLYRFASGHTHVGYSKPTLEKNVEIIQNFDFLYLSFLEKRFKESERRQATYGQPGALRHKPYGVEYRTPSNLWVNDYKEEMFDIASLSAKLAIADIVVNPMLSSNTRLLKEADVMSEVENLITKIKHYNNGTERKKDAA